MNQNHRRSSLIAPDFMSSFRLVFFLLLSIVLLFLDTSTQQLVGVKKVLQDAVGPFVTLAHLPQQVTEDINESMRSRAELQADFEKLQQENFILRTQVQRLTTLEAENNRLRALMKSSANVVQNVVIAEIVAMNFDPYRHQISLNRGQVDGVHAGQSLLADEGIVGQVEQAHRDYATAVLITDPSHTVPVQVDRNGLRALLHGRGDFAELVVDSVPNFEDIVVGDELVTSGLGGRFPRGYPVATVTSVESNPASHFALVKAKPKVPLDKLREVLLVMREQNPTIGSEQIGPFKTP